MKLIACQPSPQNKQCTLCKKWLSHVCFHRRSRGSRDGRRSACKFCTNKINKERHSKRPRTLDLLKHKVRARTQYAIRTQKLTKKPCQCCGAHEVQAHHPDYASKQAHLNVIWLCQICHALEHGKRAWTNQLDIFTAILQQDPHSSS